MPSNPSIFLIHLLDIRGKLSSRDGVNASLLLVCRIEAVSERYVAAFVLGSDTLGTRWFERKRN